MSLHEGLFNLAAVGVKSPNQINENHLLYRSANGNVMNVNQYKNQYIKSNKNRPEQFSVQVYFIDQNLHLQFECRYLLDEI